MAKTLMTKKTTGMITPIDYNSTSNKIVYWCFFAVVLILALICVLPVAWVFLSAFKSAQEFLQTPPTIIPRSFHPEKIPIVWNTVKLGGSYINSLIYVAGCWFFNITCNGLAGYVLSKVKPKGHKMMFKVIFWAMLLPTSMNLIPLFLSFTDLPVVGLNIIDTYWPMWLMHGVAPFTILLYKNFFDAIPMSYAEAAKIDGCSDIGIFIKIMIPLSMPIFLVTSILCINTSWSEFMWPMIVVKDYTKFTVSMIVYNAEQSLPIDQYFVVLFLSILPPLCVFAVFGRKMMGGIALGGIKG